MQPLLDGPRTLLDANSIRELLTGATSIKVKGGADWLDSSFNYVDDLTNYMSKGSTISSDSLASIHRSCNLRFDSNTPFNYVTDFVHPYVVMTNQDTGFSARFNLGVYSLQTPVFDNSVSPSVLSFTGYDLLYLLDMPIGDTYELASGADPITAAVGLLASALPAATVAYEDTAEVASQVYTWPFDDQNQYTYLQVINALLKMVGYRPLWVDWDGQFQMHPFRNPMQLDPEWTFDVESETNIVAVPRSSVQDFFSIPNWWRFVQSNLSAAPVEGTTQITYIDTQESNPGSFANRGYYRKKAVTVDATSTASLWAQAVAQIQVDLSPAEVFDVSTAPFPLAWHQDIIAYSDPNIEAIKPTMDKARKVQALTWTISLDGADTTWTWQTINTTLGLQDAGVY